MITETSYIETYFRSHEVPVPLLLIEEVGRVLVRLGVFTRVACFVFLLRGSVPFLGGFFAKESFGLFSDKGDVFCFCGSLSLFSCFPWCCCRRS